MKKTVLKVVTALIVGLCLLGGSGRVAQAALVDFATASALRSLNVPIDCRAGCATGLTRLQGDALPAKAVITNVYMTMTTAFTATTSAAIQVKVAASASDTMMLYSGFVNAGYAPSVKWTAATRKGYVSSDNATAYSMTITTASPIYIYVTGAAVTGGMATVHIEYYMPILR